MKDKKSLILAVDDQPKNLQFLGKLLSDNGYEVGMAQDGKAALTFIKNNLPDLVLLDVMMPGMDGLEVCREIKKVEMQAHIPVIFLTAKSDADEVVKGFDAGGSDYVSKPFHPAELLARIRTHLEITALRGLLPICSRCKKIRDDNGFWDHVDRYIEKYSPVKFTHGICPSCLEDLYGRSDWYQRIKGRKQNN